jgi:hypothetical protein
VSAIFACLLRGRSTPAIRAIVLLYSLTLALLVFRSFADHTHHTLAVDDLALIADFLYRCSYFHKNQPSAVSTQPSRRGYGNYL